MDALRELVTIIVILEMVGQALGVVAIGLGFASYQARTQKKLLLLQTVTAFVFCVHYLLIGATAGMALNVVNVIRNGVYFERNRRGIRDKLIPSVFAIVITVIGIWSAEAWYSVFALLAALIHTYCIALSDPQKVRASILVTSPMMLIYDVFAGSFGGIVYESVAVASSAIGLYRNRKKETKDTKGEDET